LTPVFGAAPVRLKAGKLGVHMPANSLAIYAVQ
jgi:hypothetical protein